MCTPMRARVRPHKGSTRGSESVHSRGESPWKVESESWIWTTPHRRLGVRVRKKSMSEERDPDPNPPRQKSSTIAARALLSTVRKKWGQFSDMQSDTFESPFESC